FGVVFAGATHDFIILVSSMRRNGRSLAEIARSEISPVAGATAMVAILFIIVIALAGLGIAVVNALADSSWGTFTIFLTIPIALVVGLYLHKSKAPFAIRNGAMLCEGLVGCVALIAVCALHPGDYYAINVAPAAFAKLGLSPVNLHHFEQLVGETLVGRTGGAVSLAVGFAQIFAGIPFLSGLMSYWYHFAIMFEALFILTTIDTGTRVARFMVQAFAARFVPRFEVARWLPGTIRATPAG